MADKIHNYYDSGNWGFHCLGCGYDHSFRVNDDKTRPQWAWNGSKDKPTFTPSLMVNRGESSQCHSYVTDGKIQFLQDSWHDLKGQTVELPDWEEKEKDMTTIPSHQPPPKPPTPPDPPAARPTVSDSGVKVVPHNTPAITNKVSQLSSSAQVFNNHEVQIKNMSKDPSQVFPYLVECTCGFQARVATLPEAQAVAENHLAVAKARKPK